jgi:hypothetical protein
MKVKLELQKCKPLSTDSSSNGSVREWLKLLHILVTMHEMISCILKFGLCRGYHIPNAFNSIPDSTRAITVTSLGKCLNLSPLGLFLPGSQSSFVVYLHTDCNLLCWSFIVCPLSFISSHFHQRKRRKRVQSNSRSLESSRFAIHERVLSAWSFPWRMPIFWFHVWEFRQVFDSMFENSYKLLVLCWC